MQEHNKLSAKDALLNTGDLERATGVDEKEHGCQSACLLPNGAIVSAKGYAY